MCLWDHRSTAKRIEEFQMFYYTSKFEARTQSCDFVSYNYTALYVVG
jgi:hypothetical protein